MTINCIFTIYFVRKYVSQIVLSDPLYEGLNFDLTACRKKGLSDLLDFGVYEFLKMFLK